MLNIIADSREQKVLDFSPYNDIKIERDKLDAGDYTIREHDLPSSDFSIIIEKKKDTRELITNLASKWEVFEKEMQKLRGYKIKQIVVGEPESFQYLFDRGFSKVHPNFLYHRLSRIYVDYGVSTIFLPNLNCVASYVYYLFKDIHKKIKEDL